MAHMAYKQIKHTLSDMQQIEMINAAGPPQGPHALSNLGSPTHRTLTTCTQRSRWARASKSMLGPQK